MNGDLRPGIILTVTGILALAHYFVTRSGLLPRRYELLIGIVLVVLGLPLLVGGVLSR